MPSAVTDHTFKPTSVAFFKDFSTNEAWSLALIYLPGNNQWGTSTGFLCQPGERPVPLMPVSVIVHLGLHLQDQQVLSIGHFEHSRWSDCE